MHLLARPSRNRQNAKRSVEINGFNLDLIRLLGENGEIPPAWYGIYAWRAIVKAAGLFGDKQIEEGYACLEKAVSYCEKITTFKKGDLLDTGKKELLGGVMYEYGQGVIRLSDGTKEPIDYEWEMEYNASKLLYSLTASHGWEWFNSVRNDERFKEYVERVRRIVDKK